MTTGMNGMPRRSFIRNLALGGAGASLALAGNARGDDGITHGDAAILRFLAAAEILETDLWQQYAELATNNPAFNAALSAIDGDMTDYVTQNTNDEVSHQDFLNGFLSAVDREAVNLDEFRTLPSSKAAGAQQVGRLTSLMHLDVDTSWYLRYRSSGNPDFGDSFGQVETIIDRPGIPLHDGYTANQIQAIANTAAYHFAMIEQGGSSLYDAMSLKASKLTTLRIVTSIGGTEVNHFAIWHDQIGNIPPVDSGDGLVFTTPPDPEDIMPKPCKFLSADLPLCSIIRPTSEALAGPMAVVNFLTQTGLFHGQSHGFFRVLNRLAAAAEAAHRGF